MASVQRRMRTLLPHGARGAAQPRGILAPAQHLDIVLHIVLLALLTTGAVRYLLRHEWTSAAAFVLIGAVLLAVAHSLRTLPHPHPRWAPVWVLAEGLIWGALTTAAPSFAWCAVPVAFAALRVLPFAAASGMIAAMTVLVGLAWSRMTPDPDPAVFMGPLGIALVTVLSYRALDRQAEERKRLLDELTAAQAELAAEQRRSGALHERTRLSREIHDSVGQGLLSINLLLQAAEQEWRDRPETAREHMTRAAATSRESLEEVRAVVSDLAEATDAGTGPEDRLRRLAASEPHLDVEVRVHGTPVALAPDVATALTRTAQGALANASEHAHAARAVVTLTYTTGEVLLDVRDDGRGFEPADQTSGRGRGRGLPGIIARACELGGSAVVESAPGEGTAVSVRLPLEDT